jgi:hypothetical protein
MALYRSLSSFKIHETPKVLSSLESRSVENIQNRILLMFWIQWSFWFCHASRWAKGPDKSVGLSLWYRIIGI